MAVLSPFLKKSFKEEEEQAKGLAASTTQPIGTPQGAPSIITGGQQATGPAPQGPSSSGRFVNIQKYFDANKGAAERGVMQAAEAKSTEQQKDLAAIKEKVTGYKAPTLAPNTVQNIISNPADTGAAEAYKSFTQAQVAAPTLTSEELTKVGAGGKTFTDLAGLTQDQSKLPDVVKGLLGSNLGNYTAGKQRLDSLLLSQPGVAQSLGSKFSNIAGAIGAQAQDIAPAQVAAQKAAEESYAKERSSAAQTLTDAKQASYNKMIKDATDAFNRYKTASAQKVTALRQGAGFGQEEFLKQLPIDVNAPTFGVDASKFITEGGQTAGHSIGSFISDPEQLKQLKALAQFSGGLTPEQTAELSKAGSYATGNQNLTGFEKIGFEAAQKQKQNEFLSGGFTPPGFDKPLRGFVATSQELPALVNETKSLKGLMKGFNSANPDHIAAISSMAKKAGITSLPEIMPGTTYIRPELAAVYKDSIPKIANYLTAKLGETVKELSYLQKNYQLTGASNRETGLSKNVNKALMQAEEQYKNAAKNFGIDTTEAPPEVPLATIGQERGPGKSIR